MPRMSMAAGTCLGSPVGCPWGLRPCLAPAGPARVCTAVAGLMGGAVLHVMQVSQRQGSPRLQAGLEGLGLLWPALDVLPCMTYRLAAARLCKAACLGAGAEAKGLLCQPWAVLMCRICRALASSEAVLVKVGSG